jgi:hypothetical protein
MRLYFVVCALAPAALFAEPRADASRGVRIDRPLRGGEPATRMESLWPT